MPKYIIYDGELTEEEDFKISLQDRAFHYGDGLFETMTVKSGKVLFAQDHFLRLMTGFDFMKFDKASFPSATVFLQKIEALLNTHQLNEARLKVNVWRREGGLFLPSNHGVHYLIQCGASLPAIVQKDKVILSTYPLQEHLGLSSIKSINSATYILSSIQYNSTQAQDALLLNTKGEIAELTSSNIFFYTGEDFVTPSLQSGCLEGIMRKNVIKALKSLKKNITETVITPKDLGKFEGCFGTNVRGLFKVQSIEGYSYTNGFELSKIENEVYR